MSLSYPIGDGGYRCGGCGGWVLNGLGHTCFQPAYPYRPPPPPPPPDRLADALERIAAALERLAERGLA